MYYVTFKVALSVSGLGIIRILILFYACTFWSPADPFTQWEIDFLVPQDPFYRYFRSRGIDLLVPRTALGGTESHVRGTGVVMICRRSPGAPSRQDASKWIHATRLPGPSLLPWRRMLTPNCSTQYDKIVLTHVLRHYLIDKPVPARSFVQGPTILSSLLRTTETLYREYYKRRSPPPTVSAKLIVVLFIFFLISELACWVFLFFNFIVHPSGFRSTLWGTRRV